MGFEFVGPCGEEAHGDEFVGDFFDLWGFLVGNAPRIEWRLGKARM